MIEVIDNFLPVEYFKFIKQTIESEYFPWFYEDCVDYANDGRFQFTHGILREGQILSSLADHVDTLYERLNAVSIIRLKLNLSLRTDVICHNSMHIDYASCKTAIVYINSNNGKTIFESGQEVVSVENRAVLFDSDNRHTGTTCTDAKRRIVLNINYT